MIKQCLIIAFAVFQSFAYSQYELVWSDEFEVDGAPCSENWILETVPPNNGSWWNNEEQYYTNRRSNSYVSNGTLKIVAKKENYENKFPLAQKKALLSKPDFLKTQRQSRFENISNI